MKPTVTALWAAQREFFTANPGEAFDEGAYLAAREVDPSFQQRSDLYSVQDRAQARKIIMALEESMRTMPSAMTECTLRHFFAPGCYGREMTIPKGVLVVGKIHKHAHLNIISKGRVRVMTEAGPMVIEAPHTFVSEVGTKRAVLAEEETIWTTIHVTSETDLAKIEDEVIAKSYDELKALEDKS